MPPDEIEYGKIFEALLYYNLFLYFSMVLMDGSVRGKSLQKAIFARTVKEGRFGLWKAII